MGFEVSLEEIRLIEALDIHVQGVVQGVGFRPFVYRTAKKYLINGWVFNAIDGVYIHAEGESKLLDEFVLELSDNAPASAQVTQIDLSEAPLQDCTTFEIRFSEEEQDKSTTLVSPDLATCDDCIHELFDPTDRRFHYPFINCTNCGPRFTIISELPYDRANTSMSAFSMCEKCAAEYSDPTNRRFHAQPNACFECGPHVSWYESSSFDRDKSNGVDQDESNGADRHDPDEEQLHSASLGDMSGKAEDVTECEAGCATSGNVSRETFCVAHEHESAKYARTREESDAIFARAIELLLDGNIVAVKGLGGFHLVCDAYNAQAVAKLRSRKRREGKAFAVMMADIQDVQSVCSVNDVEATILASVQRPIVLLRKHTDAVLTAGIADDLSELGVMLPCTPVQHILMHDFAKAVASYRKTPPMLVMTSGNIHNEPIVINDNDAYASLSGIADAFLSNDRAILCRFDDSVVRVIKAGKAGYAVQLIRRARGYAPQPLDVSDISLSFDEATVVNSSHAEGDNSLGSQNVSRETFSSALFATGSEQKNTFTLLRGAQAFMSQHIGDMENAQTYDAWIETKQHYEKLFKVSPCVLASDMHPEYLTSKWAHDQELDLIEVQHHHAHIVSVMAECGLREAVCGIAFDGTGYGVDGAIWGGEILLSNLQTFERFANFAYVPMPGGTAAIKHPLCMAYGVLWAYDLLDHPAAQRALLELGDQANTCETMIEQGINTPMTSSVGRLFDAASALLDVCTQPTYEGEGAILLEARMSDVSNFDTSHVDSPEQNAIQKNVSRETFFYKNTPTQNNLNATNLDTAGLDTTDPRATKLDASNFVAPEGETSRGGAPEGETSRGGAPEGEAVDFHEQNVSRETFLDATKSGALESDATKLDASNFVAPEGGSPEGGAPEGGVPEGSAPEGDVCGKETHESNTSNAAEIDADGRYQIAIIKNVATQKSTAQDTSVVLLDAQSTFRALLDDYAQGISVGEISRRFHDAFVNAIVAVAELVRALYGIEVVALSGGVFMNRYLTEHVLSALEDGGFTVAINKDLPPNDGCISFGQAVIALQQLNDRGEVESS